MPSPFFTTGPRGLIRALLGTSNVNDIDAGFLALASDVETKMVNYASGLASARPTAGVEGRVYRATDTGVISFDNGTAWLALQALVDTGWVSLPPVTGFAANGSEPPYARLLGDRVWLKGSLQRTGAAVSQGATFPWATIPSQFIPATTIVLPGSISSGGTVYTNTLVLSPSNGIAGYGSAAGTTYPTSSFMGLDGVSYTLS